MKRKDRGRKNPFAQQLVTKWLNDETTGGFERTPGLEGSPPALKERPYSLAHSTRIITRAYTNNTQPGGVCNEASADQYNSSNSLARELNIARCPYLQPRLHMPNYAKLQ